MESEKLKVIFSGPIKKYTNGEGFYEPEGCSTLRGLFDELSRRYGEGFDSFITGNDACLILVNGKGTMMSGGLDSPLAQGDKIEILPVVIAG